MRLRPSDGSGAASLGGALAAQAAYAAAVAPLPWPASIEWHFGGDGATATAACGLALPPGARMPLDTALPTLGMPPLAVVAAEDGKPRRARLPDVLPRLLAAVTTSEGACRDAVLRGAWAVQRGCIVG